MDLENGEPAKAADEPAQKGEAANRDDEAEEVAEGEEEEDAGDGEDEGPGEVCIMAFNTIESVQWLIIHAVRCLARYVAVESNSAPCVALLREQPPEGLDISLQHVVM